MVYGSASSICTQGKAELLPEALLHRAMRQDVQIEFLHTLPLRSAEEHAKLSAPPDAVHGQGRPMIERQMRRTFP